MSLIKTKARVAIFVSGHGSTAQALLDQRESLNIVCLISSKKMAPARKRAYRSGVCEYVFKFPEDFSLVLSLLESQKINQIFLAGFMKIIPASFIESFNGFGCDQKIYNIHPSLLPNYKGLKSIEKAYEDKAQLGVTIHRVVEQVDSGQFFKRAPVLNKKEISKISLAEAHLWERACEQQILKSWGSAVA